MNTMVTRTIQNPLERTQALDCSRMDEKSAKDATKQVHKHKRSRMLIESNLRTGRECWTVCARRTIAEEWKTPKEHRKSNWNRLGILLDVMKLINSAERRFNDKFGWSDLLRIKNVMMRYHVFGAMVNLVSWPQDIYFVSHSMEPCKAVTHRCELRFTTSTFLSDVQ